MEFYSYYQPHILEFFKYILPVGVAGYFVITVILLVWLGGGGGVGVGGSGRQLLDQAPTAGQGHSKKLLIYYVCLFLLCVAVVVRVLDYRIALVLVLAVTLIVDRRLLAKVDYGLLLTFVCFFVIVGNLERIDSVKNTLSLLLKGRVFIVSVLSSQVISNVPAAMMISRFTIDVRELLLGVNIGGLGTPVAALASLIAFRLYAQSKGAASSRFLGVYHIQRSGFAALDRGLFALDCWHGKA